MNFVISMSQPKRLQLRMAGPLARYNVQKKKLQGVWFRTFSRLYEVYVDPVINYASGVKKFLISGEYSESSDTNVPGCAYVCTK